MAPEKRKFTRIPLHFPATLLMDDGSIHEVKEFLNISAGGALLPKSFDIAARSKCTLVVMLSDDPESDLKIEAGGEIVRREDDNIAIRFTRIDPDSLFHLHNILRYNAANPDKVDDEIQKHPGIV